VPVAVDNEGFLGFDPEAFSLGFDHSLDGAGPDDRNVKPNVLFGLAHFNERLKKAELFFLNVNPPHFRNYFSVTTRNTNIIPKIRT